MQPRHQMLLLVGAALAVWAIMRAEGYTTQAFTTRQQFIKAAKQIKGDITIHATPGQLTVTGKDAEYKLGTANPRAEGNAAFKVLSKSSWKRRRVLQKETL